MLKHIFKAPHYNGIKFHRNRSDRFRDISEQIQRDRQTEVWMASVFDLIIHENIHTLKSLDSKQCINYTAALSI